MWDKQFHRSKVKRIEPYNVVVNSSYYKVSLLPHFLKDKISFVRKYSTRSYEFKRKDEVVSFINQNLPHFVPTTTVFPNITLKEKRLG